MALKESIQEQGLLQRPILTLGLSTERPFLCIAGHRRILAMADLGHAVIPAELIYSPEEKQVRLARLAENLVRENLKPLELAEAVARIKDTLQETTTGAGSTVKEEPGIYYSFAKDRFLARIHQEFDPRPRNQS